MGTACGYEGTGDPAMILIYWFLAVAKLINERAR